MKTKSKSHVKTQTQSCELKSRPDQFTTDTDQQQTAAPAVAAPAADHRPKIDLQKRATNRQLSTSQLLALLRAEAPRFFDIAEIVGKWVWIQFQDKQPREITAQLAQFGFHWNNKRQAWQHPCGQFCQHPFSGDPRERYAAHYAADLQPA
ncbi:MAG: hypothetical protein IAF94_03655 [Pirellulaceae bacterium]|nr:hypothetical protein [Pirellulaceae bacterium]